MMKNGDMPAMPSEYRTKAERGYPSITEKCSGLTKREMFAMHFMQAWIQHHGSAGDYGFSKEGAALSAIEFADQLLDELEKTK